MKLQHDVWLRRLEPEAFLRSWEHSLARTSLRRSRSCVKVLPSLAIWWASAPNQFAARVAISLLLLARLRHTSHLFTGIYIRTFPRTTEP